MSSMDHYDHYDITTPMNIHFYEWSPRSPSPLVDIFAEFCDIHQCPARGRGLLDGGEDGMKPGAVAVCHHGPPAGQGSAPEGEAPVVVDGVIGLGHQQEVRDGRVSGAQQPGEDDPRMPNVLPTPGQVIAGHEEHRVRVETQELPDAVEEEGTTHLVTLVPLLHKADVVCSPHMDIDEGNTSASFFPDNMEIVLDNINNVPAEEGLIELLGLGKVPEDEFWVEPLEHDVWGVAEWLWMLDVAPAGDLGPLAAHWAQALTAEVAHAVLQRKQGVNVLKVETIISLVG